MLAPNKKNVFDPEQARSLRHNIRKSAPNAEEDEMDGELR